MAGLCEIGGGYLIWLWLQKNKVLLFGLVGGMVLFVYGIIQTLQPANFGRVYAAYGGIFVLLSIIWGALADKKRPDRYEFVGSIFLIRLYIASHTVGLPLIGLEYVEFLDLLTAALQGGIVAVSVYVMILSSCKTITTTTHTS